MDKNTAEKLYEAFYMKVFSYVMTLAKDRNDAEEITQETFFRAISTDKSFRGDSDSYTWLCAIAKNIFIDEKRRSARQDDELSDELPDTNKGIEEKLSDRDTSLKIHLILHKLVETRDILDIKVIVLLVIKGSYNDVAHIHGILSGIGLLDAAVDGTP